MVKQTNYSKVATQLVGRASPQGFIFNAFWAQGVHRRALIVKEAEARTASRTENSNAQKTPASEMDLATCLGLTEPVVSVLDESSKLLSQCQEGNVLTQQQSCKATSSSQIAGSLLFQPAQQMFG